jgi:hypothetical protein
MSVKSYISKAQGGGKMKKKLYMSVITGLLLAVLLVPAATAAEPVGSTPEVVSQDTTSQVKLTDAQKKELKELF